MKRTKINRAIIPLFAAMLLSACSSDPILFEESSSFVAFNKSASKVTETSARVLIPVNVGALKGSPAVTVTVEVVAQTGALVAVEGTDFTITSKTLSFPDGLGTQYVEVKPIDNDIFTGNKTFKLNLTANSVDYPFGVIQSNTVTIVDDEHPLKLVLGNYIFAGLDAWGDPFSCNITTSAVEGDLTQIAFPLVDLIGYGAPSELMVVASIDLTAGTFKIKTGQTFATWGYGPCKINGYDADGNDLAEGDNVTGTIDANGNITMNEMLGVIITSGSNLGASFAIYGPGSVWTKQ